ncbi:Beta-ketoacyl synthase [Metarhizium guizhouense ARSEF 977]|uniref:Beta-ketoacyl synthase n=1 Tax=Metarhizium guizhouense (strain ARSEF 977) TaxID=1276136 RepID=A0A0B4GTB9_METGA|nr:Beta-ketoacyl synthase [Metarhizium guizhouense ARSEF 977]
MTLEGALQLSDKSRTLYGFRFRGVSFERGLIVPSDKEGAVNTSLSLLPDKHVPGQYVFTIFSTTASTSWTKHCHGKVLPEDTSELQSEFEESVVDVQWSEQRQHYQPLANNDAAEFVDVDDFYDHLHKIGMEYGPMFRNVVSLQAIPSSKTPHGAVIIPDTKSSMPEEFEYPHTMHAATMDTVFHLLLVEFNDGRPVNEAAAPYSISDIFVAAGQPLEAGTSFLGWSIDIQE